MITEEVVKIGRRGQITLPSSVRQAEGFKEGDFLEIADVGGVLTLRKIEKRPNVLDLFKDVGRALQQQGVTTREDAIALIEDIKTHAARPRH
ncbi:MAG TPA: AbrB/MazE/SpoVT family DNA-binding domain-containing protein [Candidatus Nanoarchaeia archaeon]|nr:AbrB/MazE/SpoVT family DNA-binding domain-containing protein [Candidatus Nanoarchaeia archaeon]